MKAKLLKKVRKRYSIFRVDSLNGSTSALIRSSANVYGFPFYYIQDNNLNNRIITTKQTLNECKDRMIECIIENYGLNEKRRLEETKVYYNPTKR